MKKLAELHPIGQRAPIIVPLVVMCMAVLVGALTSCSAGHGIVRDSVGAGPSDSLDVQGGTSRDSGPKKPSARYVIGTGGGGNERVAIDRALESAVERAVGVWLASETELNQDLLNERILTYSAGYVSKYDLIASKQTEAGDWSVTIGALVEQRDLRQSLDEVFPNSELLVSSLTEGWRAHAITKERMEKQGVEFVREVLRDLDASYYEVTLIGEPRIVQPDPARGEVSRDGYAIFSCAFEFGLDSDRYRSQILMPLKAILAEYLTPESPVETIKFDGGDVTFVGYERTREFPDAAYLYQPTSATGHHLIIPDGVSRVTVGGTEYSTQRILDYELPSRFLAALDESEFPKNGMRPGTDTFVPVTFVGVNIQALAVDGEVLKELNSIVGLGSPFLDWFPFLLQKSEMQYTNTFYYDLSGGELLLSSRGSDLTSMETITAQRIRGEWRFEFDIDEILEIDAFRAQAVQLPDIR
jgi:hypothetical protein